MDNFLTISSRNELLKELDELFSLYVYVIASNFNEGNYTIDTVYLQSGQDVYNEAKFKKLSNDVHAVVSKIETFIYNLTSKYPDDIIIASDLRSKKHNQYLVGGIFEFWEHIVKPFDNHEEEDVEYLLNRRTELTDGIRKSIHQLIDKYIDTLAGQNKLEFEKFSQLNTEMTTTVKVVGGNEDKRDQPNISKVGQDFIESVNVSIKELVKHELEKLKEPSAKASLNAGALIFTISKHDGFKTGYDLEAGVTNNGQAKFQDKLSKDVAEIIGIKHDADFKGRFIETIKKFLGTKKRNGDVFKPNNEDKKRYKQYVALFDPNKS